MVCMGPHRIENCEAVFRGLPSGPHLEFLDATSTMSFRHPIEPHFFDRVSPSNQPTAAIATSDLTALTPPKRVLGSSSCEWHLSENALR